ncbi:MAG: mechanosensitive ion channel [Acidobacteriota bacterium]
MTEWFKNMHELVASYLGVSVTIVDKFLWSLLAVLVYLVVRRTLVVVLNRRLEDASRRYVATKTLNYLLGLFLILALLRVWLGGITGLAASIGLISAGVAIALHAPLTNLAGWLFLTVRRPFTVGDRIQIGEHKGDVIDLRLFAFSLVEIGNWVAADQSTGRILHIPNGKVFQETVANFTQGFNFIWDEVAVTVTFESNWRQAKELLTEISHRHAAVSSDEAAPDAHRLDLGSGHRRHIDNPVPHRSQAPQVCRGCDLGGDSGDLCRPRRHRLRLPDTALL